MAKKFLPIIVLFSIILFFSNVVILPEISGLKAQGKEGWKYGSATAGIVCGDRLCSEISNKSKKTQVSMEDSKLNFENYESPLKQIMSGVNPENVMCNQGLELIMKLSDGKSACVKPTSVIKLIERGWTN